MKKRYCPKCCADTLPINNRCGFCQHLFKPEFQTPRERATMQRAYEVALLQHLATDR